MAAFVRRAVLAVTNEPEPPNALSTTVGASSQCGNVKITLRLSAAHAMLLAKRARVADLSQGAYVARLIDGTSPPAALPDRREALRALARSTDQLAIISGDLNAFMRLLRQGKSEQIESYRAGVMSLSSDVRGHLHVLSGFLADINGSLSARSVSCPVGRKR